MVNIGSYNGLVPDDTKPILEPMLTYQWSPVPFIWERFHKRQGRHPPPLIDIKLITNYSKFHSNLPGAMESNKFIYEIGYILHCIKMIRRGTEAQSRCEDMDRGEE